MTQIANIQLAFRQPHTRLAHDMHAGTYTIPGFEHALHNARLIEAARRADERGKRQKIAG
jgi:hypothetical protein